MLRGTTRPRTVRRVSLKKLISELILKAEADVRGWLKTYRDPDGPERVVVDLSAARWGEAWVFVDRVMDLGKRLEAGA